MLRRSAAAGWGLGSRAGGGRPLHAGGLDRRRAPAEATPPRLPGAPGLHPRRHILGGHRPGEQIALGVACARPAQQAQLRRRLHAFHDRGRAQPPRELDDGAQDRLAPAARRREKSRVDLQQVERQAPQPAQRGATGAKIVDRHLYAQGAQGGQRRQGAAALEQGAFGNLDQKPAGGQPGLTQEPADALREPVRL